MRDAFNLQFRGGYFPQESVIESRDPLYREAASPTATRARQGLARGTQEEARPGMVGKQDRPHRTSR